MKEQILELAQAQMMSGGYENLNFAVIADELSTTRANLHHHFKNKEGLALEATEAYMAYQYEMLDTLATEHPDDFPAFWAKMEDLFFQVIVEEGHKGCICGQIIRENDIPDSLVHLAKTHFARIEAVFSKIIAASQKKGLIKDDISPDRLALVAHSSLIGVAQLANIHSDDKKFLKSLKGLLTEGLKAHLK